MSNSDPVHLRRVDPAQNMQRFYSLSIQPTLFGGASLIRDWGRIGTRGQTMMETFDTADDADLAFDRLERRKRRRGYCDAFLVKWHRWVRSISVNMEKAPPCGEALVFRGDQSRLLFGRDQISCMPSWPSTSTSVA